MNVAVKELRLFFIALQFLTRVPTPRWVGFEPDWLNRSARHFPLVGACVGAVVSGVYQGAGALLPTAVAVWLSIAAGLLMTGGFHEDGLADTFDALGGVVGRDRALEIMKDSRIGTYGALALVTVIGTKAAVLMSMPPTSAVPAMLLAHVASRAAPVWLIHRLPYAGDVDHAKAKPLARRVSAAGWRMSVGWVVLAAAGLVAWRPSFVSAASAGLLLAVAATAWMHRWLRRRLCGYTGDTLGATQQLSELALLLGTAAVST